MEAQAKQSITCDFCKTPIVENGMQADLTEPVLKKGDPKPKKQIFHFCDEECLRQFLNKRAAKSKVSKGSHFSLEIDMHGR